MSSAEEHYRDADQLARDVEEDNRRRREVRETEMARLKRLHAEEAAEDRQASKYAKAMRAVRQHQLQKEPARVRRSLVWLTGGFVLIPSVGAALVWLYAAELLTQQGAPGWIGHVLGLSYVMSFLGSLAWHARACWSPGTQSRTPTVVAWVLLLLPVPILLTAALVGWTDWTAVLVLLAVFFILGFPGIWVCREIPLQYRKIMAAKSRGDTPE
ncbi:hypothetical protein [Nocardiopsis dassonvillei]|uniref:hypothetical protein n=1 Tax=Nocardiopsis dassonvillei TaxID=2014 RepID=UPI003F57B14B